MRREEYLHKLRELLVSVPASLRDEWMYDYEEHFRYAAEQGLSEEAIAQELGDPRMLAKEMLLGYRVEQAVSHNGRLTHVTRAVLAAVSLGFFNLVFLLGPFIALLGVLFALWASSAAVAVSSLAAIYEGIWGDTFTLTQGTFVAMVLLSIGMLLGALSYWLTQMVSRITLKYLKFNSRVIRMRRS